jgi:hypothetical protein
MDGATVIFDAGANVKADSRAVIQPTTSAIAGADEGIALLTGNRVIDRFEQQSIVENDDGSVGDFGDSGNFRRR